MDPTTGVKKKIKPKSLYPSRDIENEPPGRQKGDGEGDDRS